jgi:hypothetical protein
LTNDPPYHANAPFDDATSARPEHEYRAPHGTFTRRRGAFAEISPPTGCSAVWRVLDADADDLEVVLEPRTRVSDTEGRELIRRVEARAVCE